MAAFADAAPASIEHGRGLNLGYQKPQEVEPDQSTLSPTRCSLFKRGRSKRGRSVLYGFGVKHVSYSLMHRGGGMPLVVEVMCRR
jgi:hypothetical protein